MSLRIIQVSDTFWSLIFTFISAAASGVEWPLPGLRQFLWFWRSELGKFWANSQVKMSINFLQHFDGMLVFGNFFFVALGFFLGHFLVRIGLRGFFDFHSSFRMKTQVWDAVSAANTIFFDLFDESGNHVVTVKTDRFGNANFIKIASDGSETEEPNGWPHVWTWLRFYVYQTRTLINYNNRFWRNCWTK